MVSLGWANIEIDDDLVSDAMRRYGFRSRQPALFRLLSDPDRVVQSTAAQSGKQVLESRVHRVALTGRLGVSEQRCVDLIQAAGIGTIQVLLSTPLDRRDPGLAEAM